jgi:hypothetical protein
MGSLRGQCAEEEQTWWPFLCASPLRRRLWSWRSKGCSAGRLLFECGCGATETTFLSNDIPWRPQFLTATFPNHPEIRKKTSTCKLTHTHTHTQPRTKPSSLTMMKSALVLLVACVLLGACAVDAASALPCTYELAKSCSLKWNQVLFFGSQSYACVCRAGVSICVHSCSFSSSALFAVF